MRRVVFATTAVAIMVVVGSSACANTAPPGHVAQPASGASTNVYQSGLLTGTVCVDPRAKPVSVDAARADSTVEFTIPDNPYANAKSVLEAYVCARNSVATTFDSGISLLFEASDADDADAANALKEFVASDEEEASASEVRGHFAAAIDPAADPSGFAKGSVTFVENRVQTFVIGNHKISVDDLIAIAQSVPAAHLR